MSSRSYKPILPERPKVASRMEADEDHKGNSNNINNANVRSLAGSKSTVCKPDDISRVVKKMETQTQTPIIRKKLVKEPSQDIDQIAEAFIQRFKKQLHLQRLQSIENYEQMLKRGT